MTVVDGELYPVAIRAPEGPAHLDWRRAGDGRTYSRIELPDTVSEGRPW